MWGVNTNGHEASFWCDENVLKLDLLPRLHNSANKLTTIELYTSNWWVLWCINRCHLNCKEKRGFRYSGFVLLERGGPWERLHAVSFTHDSLRRTRSRVSLTWR